MNKQIPCPVEVISSRAPESIALIYGTTTLTYRQFHKHIQSAQNYCQNKGIRQGTRVAIQSENSLEYIVLLFALWRIGAMACLLSPRTPQAQLNKQIQQLKCKFYFKAKTMTLGRVTRRRVPCRLRAERSALLRTLRAQSQGQVPTLHFFNNKAPSLFINEITSSQKTLLAMTDSGTIMLTSGSSGEPKAVVHTLGNHYFNALGSNENIPVGPKNRWLLSLPLYHVSGLSILWRCVLGGGTIAISDKNDDLAVAIQKFKITHISLVPTQLSRLLEQNKSRILQKLKIILLGGGPIPDDLIQKAHKLNLPVFLTYGLTEMGSQVATSFKSLKGKIKTLKYRQLKIDNNGEVLVKGETLFKGYLKNNRIVSSVDKNGWFHTGDLGKFDSREGLRILGRKDNMFISGGENIYPEEIETALLNTGLVEEAVVIPVKNDDFGFRPVAFVNISNNQSIPLQKLKNQLSKTLPSFKIPDCFYTFPAGYTYKGIKPNRQSFITSLNLQ